MRHPVVLALALAFFAALSFAQSTGVISGGVQDSTGAFVPGANVSAILQQTSQRFETSTDDQGRFIFPRLPAGNYLVEAGRKGFRQFVSEIIRLDADQT